eukprot:scaffold232192_cov19-Tisochrysis_lutea.AAC.1
MAPTSAASGPAMLPGAASFVHPPHVAAMPPPGVYAGRGSGGMGWLDAVCPELCLMLLISPWPSI